MQFFWTCTYQKHLLKYQFNEIDQTFSLRFSGINFFHTTTILFCCCKSKYPSQVFVMSTVINYKTIRETNELTSDARCLWVHLLHTRCPVCESLAPEWIFPMASSLSFPALLSQTTWQIYTMITMLIAAAHSINSIMCIVNSSDSGLNHSPDEAMTDHHSHPDWFCNFEIYFRL